MILTFDLILVFNATFSNISAISWRPVLVVEEAGVPGENHRVNEWSVKNMTPEETASNATLLFIV
jgi:hypothetical protein